MKNFALQYISEKQFEVLAKDAKEASRLHKENGLIVDPPRDWHMLMEDNFCNELSLIHKLIWEVLKEHEWLQLHCKERKATQIIGDTVKYPIGFHFFTNLENVFGPPLNTGWTVAEYTERGEYLCDSDSGKTKNDMWLESEIDWYVNGGWKEQLPKS